MIEIVQGQSVLEWASQELEAKYSEPAHGIGLAVDGTIKAAFVFTGRTPHDVEVSARVDGISIPRRFIRYLLDYAWMDCGLSRISATTANPEVANMLARFGFQIEGIKKSAYGSGRDGLMLGLEKGGSIIR